MIIDQTLNPHYYTQSECMLPYGFLEWNDWTYRDGTEKIMRHHAHPQRASLAGYLLLLALM